MLVNHPNHILFKIKTEHIIHLMLDELIIRVSMHEQIFPFFFYFYQKHI